MSDVEQTYDRDLIACMLQDFRSGQLDAWKRESVDEQINLLREADNREARARTVRLGKADDIETCTRHSCKRKEALRGVDLEQFRPAVEADYFAWLSIPTNLQTAAGLMRADRYATLRRLCESLIDNSGKEGGS